MTSAQVAPFDAYQRRLLVFLSVASFFEGYDMFAFASVLPTLRHDFRLDDAEVGYLASFVNIGTVLAYLLIARADRWGRKRVLTVTIAGYTLFTFLTGLTTGVVSYAVLQLAARVFLIGEWATSMVIAAEEYPAERRGLVIGLISGAASLGSVVCAGVVPLLLHSPWGWRTVYFVGVVPLLVLAFARRGLRETQRFAERSEPPMALTAIWSTPHRRRMLQLSLIWTLTYVCTQPAVTVWKVFAIEDRGLSEKQAGAIISIAFVVGMPFVFFVGRLLDVLGRRLGALVIYTAMIGGVLGGFTLHGFVPLLVSMTFGVFGLTGVLPLLNTFTTELFPTEMRSSAFAWANNLLGRVGYLLGPASVGLMAKQLGWGPAMQLATLVPVAALALIWLHLPETRGKELEETARV